MNCSKNLFDSLLEGGIAEPEAEAAQSDVRERGVGLDVVGQGSTDQEPRRRGRDAPHAQWTVSETGDCLGKLAHSNRFVVREEVPAADLAPLGDMHQGASAVMDMDG
jgi:hypothetical protein